MARTGKTTSNFTILVCLAAAGALVASISSFSYASAAQVSFNPDSTIDLFHPDYSIPTIIIGLVSVGGIFLAFSERKKARGMWFANKERLR